DLGGVLVLRQEGGAVGHRIKVAQQDQVPREGADVRRIQGHLPRQLCLNPKTEIVDRGYVSVLGKSLQGNGADECIVEVHAGELVEVKSRHKRGGRVLQFRENLRREPQQCIRQPHFL